MTGVGVASRCVHVRIEGRVQGVGFRAWTEMEAVALGLRGWVRNRSDGAVEAVFHGEADTVEAMLNACRVGPRGARVDTVQVLGEGVGAYARFEVLPTV